MAKKDTKKAKRVSKNNTRVKSAQVKAIGYVIDTLTKKRFYYDRTQTVPKEPGKLEYFDEYEDGVIVYDSEPVLAPARWTNDGIQYLHPDRISKKDQIKLANLFRKEIRELVEYS